MPISQRRPLILGAFAAILAAVLTLTAASASAEEEQQAPTHPILARAFQDLGTYQGQCWTWMREVVGEATGRTVGFDYRLGFFEAGAVEVSPEAAGPGDVIQIADDAWTAPDADYPGLHTAIIVENNGDGTFDVIDSNSQWDGVVRLRDSYDPWWSAGRYGIDVHIYRIGEYEGQAPVPPPPGTRTPEPEVPAGPLVRGDYATVNTPGECLNVRSSAGGAVVVCIPHLSRVQVVAEPVSAGGRTWLQVTGTNFTGWVAAEFLVKASPPSEGSGVVAPPPAPAPFRLFIGGVGAE